MNKENSVRVIIYFFWTWGDGEFFICDEKKVPSNQLSTERNWIIVVVLIENILTTLRPILLQLRRDERLRKKLWFYEKLSEVETLNTQAESIHENL